MKRVTLTIALMAMASIPNLVMANCFGSSNYQTCSDNSGNSYNVQRYGNQTQMNGYNSGTGSTWNQHSQQIGNTTYLNGQSSQGNSWNGTIQSIGGTQYYQGTDSHGNSYLRTCNRFGCN